MGGGVDNRNFREVSPMSHDVMDEPHAILLSEKAHQSNGPEATSAKPTPKREIEADGFCTVFPSLDLGKSRAW
jgi:hypothetical protein